MNEQQFTIQAQELLQAAVQKAQAGSNQVVETGHILQAVLSDKEGVGVFLLQKTGVNPDSLENGLASVLAAYTKQQGASETYLSRDAQEAIQRARSVASKMGDQFITVEHILAGLLSGRDEVARLLKSQGLDENTLKKAIEGLRQGRSINSETDGQTFDALNKYAVNLNDQPVKANSILLLVVTRRSVVCSRS